MVRKNLETGSLFHGTMKWCVGQRTDVLQLSGSEKGAAPFTEQKQRGSEVQEGAKNRI